MYNINKLEEFTILEILVSQDNKFINQDQSKNRSIIIVELSFYDGGIQSITIKDFFILSRHFISKTKDLLCRVFLYLLQNLILLAKMYLYFS